MPHDTTKLPDDPKQSWPPVKLRPTLDRMREWGHLWRHGDLDTAEASPSRWLEITNLKIDTIDFDPDLMVMPLAGDICQTSADVLFGDPPIVTVPGDQQQANVDRWIDDSMLYSQLTEAAEQAAAWGSVYLRLSEDPDISPTPIVDTVLPDRAVPSFRHGRLTSVILWRVVDDDNGFSGRGVLRYLELHAPGRVEHALYRGTQEKLGTVIDLNMHPETAHLTPVEEYPFDRLAVAQWRNKGPEKTLPKNYGRSDLDGIEKELGAINTTWSSWMHDLRVGRGRLVIPRDYATKINDSMHLGFDYAHDVLLQLDYVPEEDRQGIEAVQFEIRWEAHMQTYLQLMERAVTSAGFAPQTFGLHIEGQAESGTALSMRERRTERTREKKLPYAAGPIRQLTENALAMMNTPLSRDERATVTFPDLSEPGIGERSETIQRLRSAQALSIVTGVAMAHPEWNETEVIEEANRIKAETELADPLGPGSTLFGIDDPDTP